MILNITPDHLNRYENKFENYINSKLRIYKNQDQSDYMILNRDSNSLYVSLTEKRKSRSFFFSLYEEQQNGCFLSGKDIIYKEKGIEKFRCTTDDISLKGEHNYANAMAVIIAANLSES